MIISVDDLRELLISTGARDVDDDTLIKAAAVIDDDDVREFTLHAMYAARAYGQLRADMVWRQ